MLPTEGQNIFLVQKCELLHKFHSYKGKKLDLLFQLHDMEETVAKKELPVSGQPFKKSFRAKAHVMRRTC